MAPIPYGISFLGADTALSPACTLTDMLGVPFQHAALAEDAGMPVVFTSGAGIEELLTRGKAVITTGSPFPLSNNVREHRMEEGLFRHASSPAVFFSETRGHGLLIHVRAEDVLLFQDYNRLWHRTQLSDAAQAFTPMTPVAKGACVRFWTKILCVAFRHHSLPLLHPWFFPDMARTHFNVRVDADWCKPEEWDKTLAVLGSELGRSSWFITCDTLGEQGLPYLQMLKKSGCEVGSHNFEHYTFRDYANNLANMRRAQEFLTSHGIECTSFVSPSAKWNPALQRAIGQFPYVYTSEFTLAHDCYPFFPAVDGKSSPALQVPVHAVSPNNFLRFSKATHADVQAYYAEVATRLYDACLPIHLYGHPHDLFALSGEWIRQVAAMPHVHTSTLMDYARWRLARKADISIDQSAGAPVIRSVMPASVSLASTRDGVTYQLYTQKEIAPDAPGERAYTLTSAVMPACEPIHRKLNVRSSIGQWLDLEYIVPVRHYRVSTFRTAINWCMKKLRRL